MVHWLASPNPKSQHSPCWNGGSGVAVGAGLFWVQCIWGFFGFNGVMELHDVFCLLCQEWQFPIVPLPNINMLRFSTMSPLAVRITYSTPKPYTSCVNWTAKSLEHPCWRMAHEFLIFGLIWIEVQLAATPLEEIASKPKLMLQISYYTAETTVHACKNMDEPPSHSHNVEMNVWSIGPEIWKWTLHKVNHVQITPFLRG